MKLFMKKKKKVYVVSVAVADHDGKIPLKTFRSLDAAEKFLSRDNPFGRRKLIKTLYKVLWRVGTSVYIAEIDLKDITIEEKDLV